MTRTQTERSSRNRPRLPGRRRRRLLEGFERALDAAWSPLIADE